MTGLLFKGFDGPLDLYWQLFLSFLYCHRRTWLQCGHCQSCVGAAVVAWSSLNVRPPLIRYVCEEVHWIQLCTNSFTFHLRAIVSRAAIVGRTTFSLLNHGDVNSCSAINVLYRIFQCISQLRPSLLFHIKGSDEGEPVEEISACNCLFKWLAQNTLGLNAVPWVHF